MCWKRLLEASAGNIRQAFPCIRGLLTVPRFLAAPEVTIAVGNVLKSAYAEAVLSDSDRRRVENAITRIPRSRFIRRYEKAESIQDRLLLCIGADRLQSAKLRLRTEQLSQQQHERANEPYVKFTGGAMRYSPTDWLRDEGADIEKKENADVIAAVEPVTEFEHKFLNAAPSMEECLAIEPYLRRLQELLRQQGIDEHISEHARGTLCAAAESVVKNQQLPKESRITQFCRALLIEGASDSSPVFDPKYHSKFDSPSWGSPVPRIEAAQGVSHLLWNYGPEDDIVQAFVKLTEDAVPAVRYQVAVGLIGFYKHQDKKRFWKLAAKMMSAETTPGVMLGLVGTLGRVAGNEPELVVEQLRRTLERGLPESDRSELTRALVQILTGLYVVREDPNARAQLARFEADPVHYARAVGDEVFTASYYLTPKNGDAPVRSRARELFAAVLDTSYEGLRRAPNIADAKERERAFKALMVHIDEVASRIYFSLDIETSLRSGENSLEEDQRRGLYFELKPLIAALSRGHESSEHHLLPRTAHYVLQTLNGVLPYDPGEVIKFASHACKAASALSYQFDSLAISEVVKLVEHSLADHKEELKDASVATALGEILDIFVRAGWPEALQLTFKLDQAVR